jgi:hypothetical protein
MSRTGHRCMVSIGRNVPHVEKSQIRAALRFVVHTRCVGTANQKKRKRQESSRSLK